VNIGNRLRHILRFPRTLYASTLPAYAGVTLIIWWAFASLTEAGLAEAIYFVTGAIVLWYTVETHAMRREVTRQITLQIRPFLAIEYGEDGKMWIYNIGKGVARDIRYHTVPLAEANPGDTILTVQWKPTDFLPEGQRREMIGEGAFVEGEDRAKFSERMAVWLANFGPHGRARYEFLVDYSDLTGTQYRAAFKVDSGHTQLLRDAELKGETRPAERSRTVSEDTPTFDIHLSRARACCGARYLDCNRCDPVTGNRGSGRHGAQHPSYVVW
jgi:hypothetical protein